jgi:hypothetical protein
MKTSNSTFVRELHRQRLQKLLFDFFKIKLLVIVLCHLFVYIYGIMTSGLGFVLFTLARTRAAQDKFFKFISCTKDNK